MIKCCYCLHVALGMLVAVPHETHAVSVGSASTGARLRRGESVDGPAWDDPGGRPPLPVEGEWHQRAQNSPRVSYQVYGL